MKYLLVLGCLILSLTNVIGQEINDKRAPREAYIIKEAVTIRSLDTKIFDLRLSRYIGRVAFEAKKCLSNKTDGKVEMIADGQFSRMANVVKKGWRSFIFTFNEYVRELEVKNLFKTGCIKIRNMKILRSRFRRGGGGDYYPGDSDAFSQVAFLQESVEYLFHLVDANDRSTYLDPFIIILGKSLSILESSSSFSADAKQAIEDVINFLERSDEFWQGLLVVPSCNTLARDVLSTKRILKRMITD